MLFIKKKCDSINKTKMNISLKSLKDSLMQSTAVDAISEKAILASHVSLKSKTVT